MTKNKKEVILKFGIKKISILDFFISSSHLNLLQEPIKYRFNFNMNFAVDSDVNEVIFGMDLKVVPETNHDNVLGTMKIDIRFLIVNIVNFLSKDKKQINLPDAFMASLIGIVISTARGVWASKVMGTKLENAILPIMNSHLFLKSMKEANKKINN